MIRQRLYLSLIHQSTFQETIQIQSPIAILALIQ